MSLIQNRLYIFFPVLAVIFFLSGFKMFGGLVLAIFLIFNPEISFILFIYSGIFKQYDKISFLSVDLTLLFMSFTLIGIAISYVKEKNNNFVETIRTNLGLIIPYFLLASVMLGSLVYTPALTYGIDKAARFISITAVACFAPLFLYNSERRLKIFFYTIIVFAIAMLIESVLAQPVQRGEWGFHGAFGSDYTNLARVAGFSLIITIALIFSHQKNIASVSLFVLIFFLNLYSLFYAGARAPVIAFFVTTFIGWTYIFLISKSKNKVIMTGAILNIVVIGFIFLFQDYFFTLFYRMDDISSGQSLDQSTRMRLLLLSLEALDSSWLVPLIGLGTGGFQHVAGSTYDKLGIWPHNILVEVFCENGVIGLSIFAYLLLKVYQKMIYLLKNVSHTKTNIYCICGLILYTFINALFSSDINGNRNLFSCFGLLYALETIYEKQKVLS